jgi:hypothetical protein
VPDAVEELHDGVGSRLEQAVGHAHDRDRIVDTPHDVER